MSFMLQFWASVTRRAVLALALSKDSIESKQAWENVEGVSLQSEKLTRHRTTLNSEQ